MKRILLVLITLALLISLAACKKDSYRDDLPVNALSGTVIVSLGDTDYSTADEGFLDDYFQTPDYVKEKIVCFATEGNNLNEFGIYRVTDENAGQMKDVLEKYLSDSYAKNQSWYDSYIPEETPKLRDAEVKVFGNYVVYAILSQEGRNTLFSTVEEMLAK
jgi:hypothetical protein